VLGGMLIIADGLAVQVASVVKSAPLSLAAVNISVVPVARLTVYPDVHDAQVTVTALDVLVHNVPTQTVAVLLTAPAEEMLLAVIVILVDALVTDSALTNPLLTLSMFGSELLQVVPDVPVRFRVVPSLYVPVAVSCSVAPAAVRNEVEGVTVTLLKLGLTNQSQPAPKANNKKTPRGTATLNLRPAVGISKPSKSRSEPDGLPCGYMSLTAWFAVLSSRNSQAACLNSEHHQRVRVQVAGHSLFLLSCYLTAHFSAQRRC
jgi:hypothetical protein